MLKGTVDSFGKPSVPSNCPRHFALANDPMTSESSRSCKFFGTSPLKQAEQSSNRCLQTSGSLIRTASFFNVRIRIRMTPLILSTYLMSGTIFLTPETTAVGPCRYFDSSSYYSSASLLNVGTSAASGPRRQTLARSRQPPKAQPNLSHLRADGWLSATCFSLSD